MSNVIDHGCLDNIHVGFLFTSESIEYYNNYRFPACVIKLCLEIQLIWINAAYCTCHIKEKNGYDIIFKYRRKLWHFMNPNEQPKSHKTVKNYTNKTVIFPLECFQIVFFYYSCLKNSLCVQYSVQWFRLKTNWWLKIYHTRIL